MKSYQQSIDTLTENITDLTRHLEVLRKYPPGLYRLDEFYDHSLLVLTKRYRIHQESYRNKINMMVVAEETSGFRNTWEFNVELPYGISVSLGCIPSSYTLTRVDIKDLPLYVGWEDKSSIFENMIRTGKLPASLRRKT